MNKNNVTMQSICVAVYLYARTVLWLMVYIYQFLICCTTRG